MALDLSFLLAHASHVLSTRMTAAFAEIGMTPRAYCVLNHALSGEYTQVELAKLSDLDKTTMLNTLDELERDGYAERRLSPADRRARIVAVTPAGAEVVAAGHRIADRVHGEVLAALPEESRQVFVDALVSLVGGLLAEPVECERPVRRARVPGQPPPLVLFGLGGGLTLPAVTTLGMAAATDADAGVVSGVFNTSQQVGGALGVAVLTALAAARTGSGQTAAALADGYRLAWEAGTLLGAASVVVAAVLLRPRLAG